MYEQSEKKDENQTEVKNELINFITKRTILLLYFKQLYEDKSYYLNTLEFNSKIILKFMCENGKVKKRANSWTQLGYSIGDLLAIPNTVEYVRALNVLVMEFEHDKNESTSQKMKQLLKKNKKDQGNSSQYTTNITFTELPNIPFEVDFLHTFFSLCDVMVEAYKKFAQVNDKYLTKGYIELIMKIDTNIKKILNSIIKEIDNAVRQILANEFNVLMRSLIEV